MTARFSNPGAHRGVAPLLPRHPPRPRQGRPGVIEHPSNSGGKVGEGEERTVRFTPMLVIRARPDGMAITDLLHATRAARHEVLGLSA